MHNPITIFIIVLGFFFFALLIPVKLKKALAL